MYLKVSTRIPLEWPDVDCGLLTHYNLTICDRRAVTEYVAAGLPVPKLRKNDAPDYPSVKIGTATVHRLHLSLCGDLDEDVFEVCDANSQIWCELCELFLDHPDAMYKDRPELHGCVAGDLLLIEDIELNEPYTKRGVEMAVAWHVIQKLGAGCDLVAYWFGNKPEELELLKPIHFELARTSSNEPTEYGFLNLTYSYPAVVELQDDQSHRLCKFEAKEHDNADELEQVNELN